jgi:hypothetical protein
MNNWYIDLKVESERHKDEARQAAAYHLARQASRQASRQALRQALEDRPASAMRMAFYWRWLASLGALLVSWGCRLQTRYADRYADATLHGLASFSGSSGTEPCSS